MDKYLADNKEPKGPLHGLPISLKDQFTMKGLETTNGAPLLNLTHLLIRTSVLLGYVANIGDFAMQDCVLVEILYELGAVPFVRTNVPQTLMVRSTILAFLPNTDVNQIVGRDIQQRIRTHVQSIQPFSNLWRVIRR